MQNHTVLRARSKKIAALAATGLVAATFSTLSTAPAQAKSAPLNYACDTILGEKVFTVVTDTNAPVRMPAGKKFAPVTKAKVTIPADVVDPLRDILQASSAEGTSVVKALINGIEHSVKMTVPLTKVPSSGSMSVAASGKGKAIKAGNAGSKIKIVAGDFTSNLTFKKADGSEAFAGEIPCVLDPGQNAAVDTIKIVKAGSKTKLATTYKKAKKVLRGKATVKSATGIKAPGKVRFIVKKNGKAWKKKVVKVNKKGVANAAFPKAKKGKYVVTAKYLGSKNVKASKKIAKRTVK